MINVTSESEHVQIEAKEDSPLLSKIIEIHNNEFPFMKIGNNPVIQMTIAKFLIVFSNLELTDDVIIENHLKSLVYSYKKSKHFLFNQVDCSNPSEKNINDIKKNLSNAGFKRNLYDYQLKNLYKLLNTPNGANFSVPGSGKTAVSLGIVALNDSEVTFVIVPNKGVMVSWVDDINASFTEEYKPDVIEITTESSRQMKSLFEGVGKKTIFLITYDKISRNKETFSIFKKFLQNNGNCHLFLDESHRIKSAITSGRSPKSRRGELLLEVSKYCKRRDILTGTPMTQDLTDLVSQFSFLYPLCGIDSMINSADNKNEVLKNLYVRTPKKILPLPNPIDNPLISVEMSQAQAAFYSLLTKKMKSINTSQFNYSSYFDEAGKAIMRLIELSVDPFNVAEKLLVDNKELINLSNSAKESREFKAALLNLKNEGVLSNKMRKSIELTKEIVSGGEKVIIWCFFVNSIKILSETIVKEMNIRPLMLYGGSQDIPKDIIRKFNSKDDYPILIANLESGGEGISLHKGGCKNAIYLSRTFKSGQYLQSRDRIHRVGMPEELPVNYYFLESIYPEENILPSIDRRISENLYEKLKRQNEVFDDEDIATRAAFENSDREGSEYNSGDLVDWISELKTYNNE